MSLLQWTPLSVFKLNVFIENKISSPIPLFDVLHMFIHFRTVFGRDIPPEGLFQMLTLFSETGTIGKERPTLMLHGSPD
jgi:hypothetical protein